MIIQILIVIVLTGLELVFGFLPRVDELPFGSDAYLQQGVGLLKEMNSVFFFLDSIMYAVLIYLGFRLSLLVLKFVAGSRTPHHE